MSAVILRLVASCVSCANHAGHIIREILKKGNLNIVTKGVNDYQTEADRTAQNFIVKALKTGFPGVTVVAEEGELERSADDVNYKQHPFEKEILSLKIPTNYEAITEKDIVVWVDPLDGTTEYTQGFLDHVTVLIGVSVGGRPVAGVIHQPYYSSEEEDKSETGRTIWGITGVGFGGVEPPVPPTSQDVIVTTTRTHSNASVEAALTALKPSKVIRVGGAGYKVLMLIEGKAHAYVFASPGCKRWDTCAPEAILLSLGGVLTDIQGNVYTYDSTLDYTNEAGVLAAVTPNLHETFLKILKEQFPSGLQR